MRAARLATAILVSISLSTSTLGLLAACDRGTSLDAACKIDRDCPPAARCLPGTGVCVTTTIPHDAAPANLDMSISPDPDLSMDLRNTILDQFVSVDIIEPSDL